MKYLAIIIVLIFAIIPIYGQMPTNGDYSNWNWEDQSLNNWKRKQGNGWVEINPPFLAQTERIGLMVQVHDAGDYTKDKGWRLVWAQFDGAYPWFVLFNSHKSIVRAFFYTEDTPYSDILATLTFHDVLNPGVLTFGDEFQSSTDDYLNYQTNSNDMIAVVIRSTTGVNNWCAADFPIMFDPNIRNPKYEGKRWVFQFWGCDNYDIKFEGTSTTDPLLHQQHTISTNKNAIGNNTFSANHAKFHKEMQTLSSFMQEMQNSVNGIDSTRPLFLQRYKSLVRELRTLSDIASGLVGISSGVGAVASFFRIVSGSFLESESTRPTAVTNFIQLQGTMSLKRMLGGNTISIPGVLGAYLPTGLNWQPYNCPMGTISLKSTPKIKRTTPYEKYGPLNEGIQYMEQYGSLIAISVPNYPWLLTSGTHNLIRGYKGKIVKYMFDEDLTLSLQNLEGLEMIDLKFAFVCKASGNGDRKYNCYDPWLAYHTFYGYYDSRAYDLPLANPVYNALHEQRFIIHKFGEQDDTHFGTPYYDKNKIKGVVFEVPEDTDVKLAIMAMFKSNKYSAPIIYKAVYNIEYQTVTAERSRIFCTQEQNNFKFSNFYNLPYAVTLNQPKNNNNSAPKVQLLPGFIGTNGFTAKALPIENGIQIGNTITNYYGFNCTDSNIRFEKSDSYTSNNDSFPFANNDKIVLFPNPAEDWITIKLESQLQFERVEMYNIMGNRVAEALHLSTELVNLDISHLPRGIYLIKVSTRTGYGFEKIQLK